MNSFARYNLIFAAALSAVLGFVFIANLVVDPFDIYRMISIDGFNSEKTEKFDNVNRTRKAVDILRGDYKYLIFGSSRTLAGIDPEHPAFAPESAYNSAMLGGNICEIYNYLKLSSESLPPKAVVIGLDFEFFCDEGSSFSCSEDGSLHKADNLPSRIKYFISFRAFLSSMKTIFNNLAEIKSVYSRRGFRSSEAESITKEYPHRKKFTDILLYNYFIRKDLYASCSYNKNRLEMLKRILDLCRKANIQPYIFITPLHARHLEAIRIMGLLPDFERFKTDTAKIFDENNALYPNSKPYELWDFCTYNTISMEQVPAADETRIRMNWWYDSSHITARAGNIILDLMLDYDNPNRERIEGFGEIITTQNIEEHFAKDRQNGEKYVKLHPEEIEDIRLLASSTKRFHKALP